jgi:hypothetical protein
VRDEVAGQSLAWGEDRTAARAGRLIILSGSENFLSWAVDGTYRIEAVSEARARQVVVEAAEVRLDNSVGQRDRNALALLLGRDAEYRDGHGPLDLGWRPDPGDHALIFQIYRRLNGADDLVAEAELRRVGFEFRLLTRIR